ncbi:MerR family transcriptional regulator [Vibrio vulnificus]
MYIGELAKKSGISIKAIRHYEEIGLIKSPLRQGKYRHYDASYLDILAMIKLAKSLGFTLEELKMIAQAKTQQGLIPMDLLLEHINAKRTKLLEQQNQIERMLKGLGQLEQSVSLHNACLLRSLENAEV